MLKKRKSSRQTSFLMPTLNEQCDPRHPLRKLGERIPWKDFEEGFGEYYSEEGRPAKPVRLMVGLVLLKQMYDQSDEDVVERWVENPYWQQFCGMSDFQWELPCDPSDLVYFRQRIGEQGVALILAISAQMHGKRAKESEVIVDSTVQEKNVSYPLDTKQYRKIIIRCWKLADRSAVRLRRRYRKEVRACIMAQRLRKDPRRRKAARRGHRRLRTIAGALMRELERKLPVAVREEQRENFTLYRRVLTQKPQDTDKIYSLHEPHIYCVAKGKEHKKYEFGTKASVAMTKTHGVIVAAVAHEKNLYDAHTLPEVLDQAEAVTDIRARAVIVDRGYRGRRFVDGTEVLVPGRAPHEAIASKERGDEQSAFVVARHELSSRSLAISKPTFGCYAASSKASKAINSISCWPPRPGTSANGCGCSCFFGFASSARSLPKTSASLVTKNHLRIFQGD